MIKKKAFTLIEILVVVTIIGLLAGVGAVTYSQFIKQSRDARRKADFELIRSALEQYRADNDAYPSASQSDGLWPGEPLPANCDETATPPIPCYMNKVPQDPLIGHYYWYNTLSDGSYKLGSFLETSTHATCIAAPNCGATGCNYCLGPYGEE